MFEQHRARDDLALMTHQIFEEAEFTRLQRHGFAAARHLVRQTVEDEIADGVAGFAGGGRLAARQDFDAGEEFGEGVGLGQVVVAAGAQSFHAIVDRAQRRQDEGWRAVVFGTQVRDHGQTIAAGQHAIDDQHVPAALTGHGEAGVAIAGDFGDMAAFAQRLGDELGGFGVILDHEHAHGQMSFRMRSGRPVGNRPASVATLDSGRSSRTGTSATINPCRSGRGRNAPAGRS